VVYRFSKGGLAPLRRKLLVGLGREQRIMKKIIWNTLAKGEEGKDSFIRGRWEVEKMSWRCDLECDSLSWVSVLTALKTWDIKRKVGTR